MPQMALSIMSYLSVLKLESYNFMDKTLEIKNFFVNSENVWVSENFKKFFLEKYTSSQNNGDSLFMSSLDLQEIKPLTKVKELVFEDSDSFLERLILLIQGQEDGKMGKLLNDSSANYFFVHGKDGNYYSILVRWEQAQNLWRCGAYLQTELKMPNVKIFFPTDK